MLGNKKLHHTMTRRQSLVKILCSTENVSSSLTAYETRSANVYFDFKCFSLSKPLQAGISSVVGQRKISQKKKNTTCEKKSRLLSRDEIINLPKNSRDVIKLTIDSII